MYLQSSVHAVRNDSSGNKYKTTSLNSVKHWEETLFTRLCIHADWMGGFTMRKLTDLHPPH